MFREAMGVNKTAKLRPYYSRKKNVQKSESAMHLNCKLFVHGSPANYLYDFYY